MNDTLLPLNRVVDRLVLNNVLVSSFVKYYKNINSGPVKVPARKLIIVGTWPRVKQCH